MNFWAVSRRVIGVVAVMLGLVVPAMAHPHILIDAKAVVVFDSTGAVAGLRHAWTFDAAFSAWMVQGLDTNGDRVTSPEELQPLADENMADLADFGFYTYAGARDAPMAFTAVGDQRMVYDDGRVTLSFSVNATTPLPAGGRFELAVYDPEYYVAISFAEATDVTLENAPDSCAAVLVPPTPMDRAVEERLYALGPEVLELPPDLAAAMRGTQGMIAVNCGAAPVAATALEAANQVAEARPATPFGGPPPEPGLNLPRSGFFGWLQDQQRNFYGAMTNSLDALRTDWTAFWVLGGLSFLYGVFHAAGPGHGKVVISSYVLANETQLRRGVSLSVLSAMLQSLVAVVFVLIAAGLMGLGSVALGDAANWIGIASYGLVALLGLWLVARKIFGWGHHHHHHEDMTQKARGHLHDHVHEHHRDHDHHDGHAHVVTPQAASGSWREQLGVVLAVGLRPCSGALVVLVFALSQGLLVAGIAAMFLMGAGTAITVALLATLAVTAKGLARRIGGVDNPVTGAIVWWVELLGAFAVLAFGVLLLIASL
ncbi:HoxN/HupN/NixA family nickel/cobalt transporter [Devosia sp. A369]